MSTASVIRVGFVSRIPGGAYGEFHTTDIQEAIELAIPLSDQGMMIIPEYKYCPVWDAVARHRAVTGKVVGL